MSGETARQWRDEDTQVGFTGHMTNQAKDRHEQIPDDLNRRQRGSERSPDQQDSEERKNKKQGRSNRK